MPDPLDALSAALDAAAGGSEPAPSEEWLRTFAVWVLTVAVPALDGLATQVVAKGHQATLTTETHEATILHEGVLPFVASEVHKIVLEVAAGRTVLVVFQITSTEGLIDVSSYLEGNHTGDAAGVPIGELDAAAVLARATDAIVAGLGAG